jgi:tRNA pseudouridine55 synthase
MFGFFVIDKPPGPTSHDIVASVRRRAGRGVKIGHAGTLDPFARGVLVVCAGQATRLADYVQAQPKRYRAVVRLGATSTTDDPDGEVTPTPSGPGSPKVADRGELTAPLGCPKPDEADVRRVVAGFVGKIDQVPCSHSAVHVEGRRAYTLARAGREVSLPSRPVVIHAIDVLRWDWPELELDVRCGSGTYIRALARDIGAALQVGGYCQALTRTAVGTFDLTRAVAPDALDPARDILPPTLALGDMPRVVLDESQLARLRNGNLIDLPEPALGEEIALLDSQGNLLALAQPRAGGCKLQPTKVFLEQTSEGPGA